MSKLITYENVSQAVFHWYTNSSFKHTKQFLGLRRDVITYLLSHTRTHCNIVHLTKDDNCHNTTAFFRVMSKKKFWFPSCLLTVVTKENVMSFILMIQNSSNCFLWIFIQISTNLCKYSTTTTIF